MSADNRGKNDPLTQNFSDGSNDPESLELPQASASWRCFGAVMHPVIALLTVCYSLASYFVMSGTQMNSIAYFLSLCFRLNLEDNNNQTLTTLASETTLSTTNFTTFDTIGNTTECPPPLLAYDSWENLLGVIVGTTFLTLPYLAIIQFVFYLKLSSKLFYYN